MAVAQEGQGAAEGAAPADGTQSEDGGDKGENLAALRKKFEAAEAEKERLRQENETLKTSSPAKPSDEGEPEVGDDDLVDGKTVKKLISGAVNKALEKTTTTINGEIDRRTHAEKLKGETDKLLSEYKTKYPKLMEETEAKRKELIKADARYAIYGEALIRDSIPLDKLVAAEAGRLEKERQGKTTEFRTRPGMPPTSEPGTPAPERAPGIRGLKDRVRAVAAKHLGTDE